jgi:hypothetical protein
LALIVFAISLFVSAFLLFLVQPMVSKMILPRLGGTPQVWNTCMVFFQACLLAGYAYSHFVSTRLKPRSQLLLHGAMLVVPLALLLGLGSFYDRIAGRPVEVVQDGQTHIVRQGGFVPTPGANPIPDTLFLLTIVVGLPFLVVSTSAPLLQKWFAHTGHPAARDPYFLYGASNLGSFLALASYPFLVEPYLFLQSQAWTWTIGYIVLAVLVGICAVMVWTAPAVVRLGPDPDKTEPVPDPLPQETKAVDTGIKAGSPAKGDKSTSFKKGAKQGRKHHHHHHGRPSSFRDRESAAPPPPVITTTPAKDVRLEKVTPLRRLRWVGLAAVPVSMMLGMTTYVTTDLSPSPFLWLIPLMLYLLTFVLVFARRPIVWVEGPHQIMVIAQPFALAILVLTMVIPGLFEGRIVGLLFVQALAFFITTLVCHGELAKDRPSTEHLTEFYLMMALGGVIGGMFNALIAPVAFVYGAFMEYFLAIFFAGILRPQMRESGWIDEFFSNMTGQGSSTQAGGKAVRRADAVAPSFSYLMDIAVGIIFLVLMLIVVASQSGLVSMLRGIAGASAPMAYLGIVFGIPLMITVALMGRPLRYGLALGAILFANGCYEIWGEGRGGGESVVYRDRSYFGILKVNLTRSEFPEPYTTLIHGRINHGMNFRKPDDVRHWGDPAQDYSRLPTTYYHRKGPAGVIMEKFNWFPDPDSDNTFKSDARMPASLVGFAASPLSPGIVPTGVLVDLWSEPPYATIGLGTGTMADYARPFQHMHYYEIDSHIVRLSSPPRFPDDPRQPTDRSVPLKQYRDYLKIPLGERNATYFTGLADARARGAELWVLMGDARLRMAMDYEMDNKNIPDLDTQWNNAYSVRVVDSIKGGGPENFYHMMVVDAFSSDAIPVHLITKEAIRMYFTRLSEKGVLCVHTSNRFVDLVRVVADVADDLGLVAYRGHDQAPQKDPGNPKVKDRGHFTSEWVMVARKGAYFDSPPPMPYYEWDESSQSLKQKELTLSWHLEEPTGYTQALKDEYKEKYGNAPTRTEPYWSATSASANHRYLWTDDYSNLMGVLREFLPRE